MSFNAPSLVGAAAALLLLTDSVSASRGEPLPLDPGVELICPAGPSDVLCAALADVLTAQGRGEVRILTAPGPTPAPRIRFHETTRRSDLLAGYLSWDLSPAQHGRGPRMELAVMDADLVPDALRAFARQLVRHAHLPR